MEGLRAKKEGVASKPFLIEKTTEKETSKKYLPKKYVEKNSHNVLYPNLYEFAFTSSFRTYTMKII